MGGRVLMLQGTGSDVGKSTLVMGLCRLAARRGLRVAPFKPQNMSNNAAACPPAEHHSDDGSDGSHARTSGGEIGRAQALQARAAGLAPRTDFNPVLLKPQSDRRAQLVVNGQVLGDFDARDYFANTQRLLDPICAAFYRLQAEFDLVLVEGAGSAAETNLRDRDVANMGFAAAVGAPVCLIGDIDRGGVIASVVGTKAVLAPDDAARICGFVINKFRGDPDLFADGMADIVARTGWPSFGLIPWQPAAAKLPAEDSVVRRNTRSDAKRVIIRAPMLSRLANFDDADPLAMEDGVDFAWVPPGRPIPQDADVIIVFGTKSTIGDLDFVRAQGWHHDIIAHVRAGGRVLGLCGGYQMLGQTIADPQGVDGPAGTVPGLGLLDVDTVMAGDKRVAPVTGHCALTGAGVSGYEIHVGHTRGPDAARPMLTLPHGPDGARRADGLVEGCYVHGLFANDEYRRAWLGRMGASQASTLHYEAAVEAAIDAFADGLDQAMDMDALLATAREPCPA